MSRTGISFHQICDVIKCKTSYNTSKYDFVCTTSISRLRTDIFNKLNKQRE
uniref:Uncharacterized protein n=1 Tax=Physcomitrium patens TaxID=3218 RepID=A0A2K1KW09_PHYPA|nr:hypothetical protein PHYPA_004930 [Physcomitrium patens]